MTVTDTAAAERAAIISEWSYTAAAPPPPTVAPPAPADSAKDGEGSPADDAIDAKVSDALDKIEQDVDEALKLQATDPGTTEGDAPDKAVTDALNALKKAVADAKDAQSKDAPADDTGSSDGPAAEAPTKPAPPVNPDAPTGAASTTATFTTPNPHPPATTLPPPPAGKTPPGPVDPEVACADCGHLADAHQGSTNLGPCQIDSCPCAALTVPDNGEGDNDTELAAGTATFAPTPVVVDGEDATTDADGAPANANSPDDGQPVDEDPNQALGPGQVNGPAFVIPVGVTEGIPTSDGRMIAPNALTWRTPPLPLMAMWENDDGHKGAKLIGRIDEVFRDGPNLGARGVFDSSTEGLDAARMVAAGITPDYPRPAKPQRLTLFGWLYAFLFGLLLVLVIARG